MAQRTNNHLPIGFGMLPSGNLYWCKKKKKKKKKEKRKRKGKKKKRKEVTERRRENPKQALCCQHRAGCGARSNEP